MSSTRCVNTHGTSPTAPPEPTATVAAALPAADAPAASPASAAIAFGVRLRILRQRHGHSQQTLGDEIFYSRECVALVERGLRKPTATFVERAEAALHADGQLRHEFACVEQAREQQARQRAVARRGQRRHGKIRSAVATLRTVHRDEVAAEPSAAWLAAFDELHHVLKDEMELHDADAEIADLEHRRTGLAACAGGETRWADVAVEAALGVAEADRLLHRSLSGDHVARVHSIAGAFAALVGDAMMMLACPVPADAWHRLAEAVGDRQVRSELERQEGAESQPAVQAERGSSRLVLNGRSAARAGRRAGIRDRRRVRAHRGYAAAVRRRRLAAAPDRGSRGMTGPRLLARWWPSHRGGASFGWFGPTTPSTQVRASESDAGPIGTCTDAGVGTACSGSAALPDDPGRVTDLHGDRLDPEFDGSTVRPATFARVGAAVVVLGLVVVVVGSPVRVWDRGADRSGPGSSRPGSVPVAGDGPGVLRGIAGDLRLGVSQPPDAAVGRDGCVRRQLLVGDGAYLNGRSQTIRWTLGAAGSLLLDRELWLRPAPTDVHLDDVLREVAGSGWWRPSIVAFLPEWVAGASVVVLSRDATVVAGQLAAAAPREGRSGRPSADAMVRAALDVTGVHYLDALQRTALLEFLAGIPGVTPAGERDRRAARLHWYSYRVAHLTSGQQGSSPSAMTDARARSMSPNCGHLRTRAILASIDAVRRSNSPRSWLPIGAGCPRRRMPASARGRSCCWGAGRP